MAALIEAIPAATTVKLLGDGYLSAQDLGAASAVSHGFGKITPDAARELAHANAQRALRDIADVARSPGVPWVAGDEPANLAAATLPLALAPPAGWEVPALAPVKSEEVLRARFATTFISDDGAPPPCTEMDDDDGASWLMTARHVEAALWAASRAHLLAECVRVRKLLAIPNRPPIDPIIALGAVPSLVKMLELDKCPDVQFEAAWALTNIASGTAEHTRAVVDARALPAFVRLLAHSPSIDVREQCTWAIGNLAGDGPALRDTVLGAGALPPLLAMLDQLLRDEDAPSDAEQRLRITRNAAWTLSNLVRGKPRPELSRVRAALPTLERLARHTDDEVVTDACWALSYVAEGDNTNIQAVIDSGVVPHLLALLARDFGGLTPALRAVGNILTGDDAQTQTVLDGGLLPALRTLIGHAKKGLRKETCWAISNITAGTVEQKQAVVDAGFVEPLIALLVGDEWDVRKEAFWAVANLMQSGDLPAHVDAIVRAGAIEPLVALTTVGDDKIPKVALEALASILKFGELRDGEIERQIEVRTLGADDAAACGGECPIAWVPFAAGDEVARLPCGHEFKRVSLDPWLKRCSTCPVCRHQLACGNSMATTIAAAGGLEKFQALQQHSDSGISQLAQRLLAAYFSHGPR